MTRLRPQSLRPRPYRLVPCVILLCALLAPGCGRSRADTHGVHMQRGVEAYTRGDYKRALSAFEKALQFNKNDPQTYLFIAELYDDYLGNKLEAIAFYREFLKRSQDKKLNARVRQWIAEAEADVAGETPGTDLVMPEDPETELKELRTRHARTLILLDKYRARVGELEAAPAAHRRVQRLPWLVAAALSVTAAAVVLVARMGWVPRRRRVVQEPAPTSELDQRLILGRYFWVENEFNLGTVAIAKEDGKIRVESTSLSTNARSVGYGSLEKDALKVELADDTGLTAPTVFRFSPDGMSFTAEWTDDLGPGMAIGVRER